MIKLNLSRGSNSLNSASGNIYIFLEIFLALNVGVITMVVYVSVYLRMIFNTVIRMTWRRMMENRTCNLGHNLESRYKYLKGLYTNFQVSLYLQSGVLIPNCTFKTFIWVTMSKLFSFFFLNNVFINFVHCIAAKMRNSIL